MNDFTCEFCQKPVFPPNYMERIKFEGNNIWLCQNCILPASIAMGLVSNKMDNEDIVSGEYERVKKVSAPELSPKEALKRSKKLERLANAGKLTPKLFTELMK